MRSPVANPGTGIGARPTARRGPIWFRTIFDFAQIDHTLWRMAGFDFDAAVVGGGSAGYAAARTLAAGGAKVAVIDGARELGGLCILRGCMPTKALLQAAELRHAFTAARDWGITIEGEPDFKGVPTPASVHINLKRLMARKNHLIQEFAKHRQRQLADGRFTVIRAHAKFFNPHTVVLSTGQTLSAAHFVIATGSQIAPPPFRALAGRHILDSDTSLSLTSLPEDLAVLGGGAVACEFAQIFARLGVPVSLVQRSAQLLRHFDADVAEELSKAFVREGIKVYKPAKIEHLGPLMGRFEIRLRIGDEVRLRDIYLKQIFNGLGRLPATDHLDLPRAGVELLPSGHIRTDLHQRTSVPNIFAAGDCAGPHEIVHVAIQQGETAARAILQTAGARPMDYRLLISVVFTDPQVAMVGLTEKAAASQGVPYRMAIYPFNDHGKSMILGAVEGFVKLLVAPGTGEILGAAAVGPQAGELIHEIVVAMAKFMTAAELAAIPHYHPTLAEIWTYPAEELAEKIAVESVG